MRNLRFLWNLFEWASGLKINFQKTELFYLGVRENHEGTLANILGCKIGTFPTTYLGLPLSPLPPTKDSWRGIITKIQHRIDGWQAKLLSRGGRLILVNAVLANIPLYFLSIFKAPKWVTKTVEGLRRDFFWKGGRHQPGTGCLVAWKNVCKSKAEGGLGILDVESMNTALLTKWWWKLFKTPNQPWCKIIRALNYRRRRPLREGATYRPSSYWWKGVLSTREIFKWGISHALGNGRIIDFWVDRWCGDTVLREAFPDLYETSPCKGRKIADCIVQDGWSWPRILGDMDGFQAGPGVLSQVFKEQVSRYCPTARQDEIQWRWTTSGLFTVKSTYTRLTDGGTRDRWGKSIWSLRIPLKIRIFCWLVLKRRIPTTTNLAKTGWSGDTHCVMCRVHEETVDHLFAHCVVFRYLVVLSTAGVQLQDLGGDVQVWWERWAARLEPQKTGNRLIRLAACWWIVWKERNDQIFRSIPVDTVSASRRVDQVVNDWLILSRS